MKKIIITLLLLIPLAVNAEEYPEDEREYKYYKIVNHYGPYELEETENEEYPLINYDDYIYSDYSDWTFEKLDKEHETKTVYKYSTVSDTNNILITDFSNSYHYVDVTGIKVLYKDKEVPYEISDCFLCENDFENKLKEGKARVDINGKVTLKLDKNYPTDDLNVELKFISQNTWVTWAVFNYRNDDVVNSSDTGVVHSVVGEAMFDMKGKDLVVKNREKIIYKDKKEDNDKDEFIEEETMYRYRDKLYQKYNEEKIYTDYLLENPNPNEYFKDETLYKDLRANSKINTIPNKNSFSVRALTIENDNIVTNENVDTIENTIAVEEPLKMESHQVNEIPKSELGKIIKTPKDNLTTENVDYSFALLFLAIPLLLLIKIILVLSKLYKEKQKSVNL